MALISRRDLLSTGLALTASSLERNAWARVAAAMAESPISTPALTPAALAPQKQLLFDFGWRFTFGHG